MANEVEAALVAGTTALLVSGATSFFSYLQISRQFRFQTQLERSIRLFLKDSRWPLRTFATISHHLYGLPDGELRRALIAAGALRFDTEKGEAWGLAERTRGITVSTGAPTRHRPESAPVPIDPDSAVG